MGRKKSTPITTLDMSGRPPSPPPQPPQTASTRISTARASGALDVRSAAFIELLQGHGVNIDCLAKDRVDFILANEVPKIPAGSVPAKTQDGVAGQVNDDVPMSDIPVLRQDSGDDIPQNLAGLQNDASFSDEDEEEAFGEAHQLGDEVELGPDTDFHIPRDVLKAIEADKLQGAYIFHVLDDSGTGVLDYFVVIDDPCLAVFDQATLQGVGHMEDMFPLACKELKAAVRCRNEKPVDGANLSFLPRNANRPGPRGRKYELVIADHREERAMINQRNDRLFFLAFRDMETNEMRVETFRLLDKMDWTIKKGHGDIKGTLDNNKWILQTFSRRLGQVRFDYEDEFWTEEEQENLGCWYKGLQAFGTLVKEKDVQGKLLFDRLDWVKVAAILTESVGFQKKGTKLVVIKPKTPGEKHRCFLLPYDRPLTLFDSDQVRARAEATYDGYIRNFKLSACDTKLIKNKNRHAFFRSFFKPYEAPAKEKGSGGGDGDGGGGGGLDDQDEDSEEDEQEDPRPAKRRKANPEAATKKTPARQTRTSVGKTPAKKAAASTKKSAQAKRGSRGKKASFSAVDNDIEEVNEEDWDGGADGTDSDAGQGDPDSDFAPAHTSPVASTPTRRSPRKATAKKPSAPIDLAGSDSSELSELDESPKKSKIVVLKNAGAAMKTVAKRASEAPKKGRAPSGKATSKPKSPLPVDSDGFTIDERTQQEIWDDEDMGAEPSEDGAESEMPTPSKQGKGKAPASEAPGQARRSTRLAAPKLSQAVIDHNKRKARHENKLLAMQQKYMRKGKSRKSQNEIKQSLANTADRIHEEREASEAQNSSTSFDHAARTEQDDAPPEWEPITPVAEPAKHFPAEAFESSPSVESDKESSEVQSPCGPLVNSPATKKRSNPESPTDAAPSPKRAHLGRKAKTPIKHSADGCSTVE